MEVVSLSQYKQGFEGSPWAAFLPKSVLQRNLATLSNTRAQVYVVTSSMARGVGAFVTSEQKNTIFVPEATLSQDPSMVRYILNHEELHLTSEYFQVQQEKFLSLDQMFVLRQVCQQEAFAQIQLEEGLTEIENAQKMSGGVIKSGYTNEVRVMKTLIELGKTYQIDLASFYLNGDEPGFQKALIYIANRVMADQLYGKMIANFEAISPEAKQALQYSLEALSHHATSRFEFQQHIMQFLKVCEASSDANCLLKVLI